MVRAEVGVGEDSLHIGPETRDIETVIVGAVGFHTAFAGVEEAIRAGAVAVAPMVEGHCRLNQGLKESSVRGFAIHPESFPHLVSVEVFGKVEAAEPARYRPS